MENPSVRTIDRLVDILNCFTRDKAAWSLSELTAHLGLPKSTLHRFLVGLEHRGIMRRGPDDGKWRLGHQLFVWGSLAIESTGLRQVAAPIMRDLASLTGETVMLTEYYNGEIVCIDKVETGHPVRLAMEIGAVRAPHAGASSKVLMAFRPAAEVEAIIRERGLPRFCERTITDPDKLHHELRAIRERGYADSYEETDQGAWGIATPVWDWRGRVVAALGIAGPTTRYSEAQAREYVRLCCEAAARISEHLGSAASPTPCPGAPAVGPRAAGPASTSPDSTGNHRQTATQS